jgi:hypothetical protein
MNKCSTRREGPTSPKKNKLETNNGHKSEGEKSPHL